jgi:mRNA-degrading endonuclease RelE of RelBE toxin-antitoxin system
MKYRVRWSRTAEDELTRLWLSATDRAIVTAAAQEIDTRLAANAENEGESRTAGLRILMCAPLAVIYKVSPRTHDVARAWRFRTG